MENWAKDPKFNLNFYSMNSGALNKNQFMKLNELNGLDFLLRIANHFFHTKYISKPNFCFI